MCPKHPEIHAILFLNFHCMTCSYSVLYIYALVVPLPRFACYTLALKIVPLSKSSTSFSLSQLSLSLALLKTHEECQMKGRLNPQVDSMGEVEESHDLMVEMRLDQWWGLKFSLVIVGARS
jgi:hypothetical protein